MKENVYSTGYEKLNEILGGGFHSSSMVVVGARVGMGKTSLMLSFLKNLYKENPELKYLYLSLSESNEMILNRFIKIFPEFDSKKIDKLKFSHTSPETIHDFINHCNLEKYDFVFIDFIQMMRFDNESTYENLSNIMTHLKSYSLQSGTCFIIASQLSRKVEERQSHRPMLIDLRDSGSLEEVSNQVLLLIRREYYDPHDKPGLMEIIVPKNHFGESGSCNLIFRKEICDFINFIPSKYARYED